MTALALLQCQPISIVKALLEIAQVIRISDDLPSVENNVGLSSDSASRVAGDQKMVEDATFMRIDDLHRIPAVRRMNAGLVGHGDCVLFRCLHNVNLSYIAILLAGEIKAKIKIAEWAQQSGSSCVSIARLLKIADRYAKYKP